MARRKFSSFTISDRLVPPEYERRCTAILERLGWTVHVTRPGRAQDADMIAEKRGVRLVIRCRPDPWPVGHEAVQEVHAARHLYDGTMACLVAPAGFTAQARREAGRLSVRLLQDRELETLDRELDRGH